MYGDQSGEFVCGFWQDPDLEKRGRGGRSPNKFFRLVGPQFRLKIRGEGGPGAPPLDAPLFGVYRIRSSKEWP